MRPRGGPATEPLLRHAAPLGHPRPERKRLWAVGALLCALGTWTVAHRARSGLPAVAHDGKATSNAFDYFVAKPRHSELGLFDFWLKNGCARAHEAPRAALPLPTCQRRRAPALSVLTPRAPVPFPSTPRVTSAHADC